MYICYVYSTSGLLLAQIEQLQELDVQQKLSAVGTATFTVRSDQLTALSSIGTLAQTAYKIVSIVKQNVDGSELPVFTGWLVWYDGDKDFKRIACKTLNHILERREIQAETTILPSTTIYTAINNVLTALNAIYPTNITLNVSASDTIVDQKKYSYGASFWSILKDLAGTKYDWDIVPSRPLQNEDSSSLSLVLKFGTLVGTDLTNSVLFQDDVADPAGKNISVKATLDLTKLANAVKAKNGNNVNVQVNSGDITTRGIRLDATITPSGDVTQEATKELATRIVPAVKLDITPDDLGDDFYNYAVGDLVKVYIYQNDQLLDYDGTMKITEKRLDAGDTEKNTIKLWFIADDSDDPVALDKQTRERVKKLELVAL